LLQGISVPTLILHGESDPLIEPASGSLTANFPLK
jgi:predicted alpha/beta-fold hydrolase